MGCDMFDSKVKRNVPSCHVTSRESRVTSRLLRHKSAARHNEFVTLRNDVIVVSSALAETACVTIRSVIVVDRLTPTDL